MSKLYNRPNSPNFWYTAKYKGQRIRISTQMTKRRLAEKVKDEWDLKLMLGDITFFKENPGALNSIKDYIRHYLQFVESRKSHHTYLITRGVLERFGAFAEKEGTQEINGVKVTLIDEYVDSIDRRTKTMKNHLGVLSLMFKQAVKEEVILANPCEYATLPKIHKTMKHRPLTMEDLKVVFDQAGEYEIYYACLLYTGLRAGDVALLKFENIDLKKGCITQFVRKSRRVHMLPLAKPLIDKMKQLKWGSGPIFPNMYTQDEQKLNDKLYQPRKHLQQILEGAHLPKATLHSFRVTYNNLLRDAGLGIQDRQVLLAHTSSETTKIYTHPNYDLAKKYVDNLPDVIAVKDPAPDWSCRAIA